MVGAFPIGAAITGISFDGAGTHMGAALKRSARVLRIASSPCPSRCLPAIKSETSPPSGSSGNRTTNLAGDILKGRADNSLMLLALRVVVERKESSATDKIGS
jgi:hypothetical protein